MSVLVVGSSGQLAQHLRELLPAATFWSRTDADLSQPAILEQKVLARQPTFIINAAAYTAVDRAESEPELAWRVNAEAPAALARAAAKLDAPLVQVSTDYVFSGQSELPYAETDPVAPLGVYGTTKLGGELAVRAIHRKHWILRTSWVFSEFGANFVKTMLRLARERDELKVVADQRGRPTYAGHLAQLIAGLSRNPDAIPFGTYHATNGSAVSWHEFAVEILNRAHVAAMIAKLPAIQPIPTSGYPTPAKRPLNSVLTPSPALQQIAVFDWESGLDRTLAKLK
jgi:dTDP-4-dehydrorhamnose reductase